MSPAEEVLLRDAVLALTDLDLKCGFGTFFARKLRFILVTCQL